MDNTRSARIQIASKSYDLILSTKATKEIAKRYGGLENLGEKLLKAKNFELALDEIVWLVTLLANQGILINNKLSGEKEDLLTEEDIELLTSPLDLSLYKEAITEAMFKGTKRYIESEESIGKNVKVE